MGKNDFLSRRQSANRIEVEDLQKLRSYCVICQKQCRDENGFECHCMSESHQRQMEICGQYPDLIVGGYSKEFESLFLEHMKRSHRFSRVAATDVYNEYIADFHHVHMKSTQWATLIEFVKYLGKTGKCKVEDTPEGWFITYIDRDSETLLKETMKNKRSRADLADEEKQEREIKKQREHAEQLMDTGNMDGTEQLLDLHPRLLEKSETDQRFKLTLGSTSKSVDEIDYKKRGKGNKDSERAGKNGKRGDKRKDEDRSFMEELMRAEEEERDQINRKDHWLCVGIIVKVVSKDWAGMGYYKQKGIVRKVIDKYVGEIEMIETKHVVRIDQDDLETVIPQIGDLVRIINGAYRANARLLAVNRKNSSAKVQIETGVYIGKILKAIAYKDIAKIAELPPYGTLSSPLPASPPPLYSFS